MEPIDEELEQAKRECYQRKLNFYKGYYYLMPRLAKYQRRAEWNDMVNAQGEP